MSERRRASSNFVPFVRLAVAHALFVVFAIYAFAKVLGSPVGRDSDFRWVVALCCVVAVLVAWATANLRSVKIDSQGLYVRMSKEVVFVPLSQIEDVVDSRGSRGTIPVMLKEPSRAGKRVDFMPRGPHVGEEIRQRVQGG